MALARSRSVLTFPMHCRTVVCTALSRNPMRKKPVFTLQGAHQAEDASASHGAAGVGSAAAWVQSVAWAWGSDLAASGAGDGKLRLWQVSPYNYHCCWLCGP